MGGVGEGGVRGQGGYQRGGWGKGDIREVGGVGEGTSERGGWSGRG